MYSAGHHSLLKGPPPATFLGHVGLTLHTLSCVQTAVHRGEGYEGLGLQVKWFVKLLWVVGRVKLYCCGWWGGVNLLVKLLWVAGQGQIVCKMVVSGGAG